MKFIPLYIILLFSTHLFAQFAIVADKEGCVNIKNKAQQNDNDILDQLDNGFIVYGFKPENDLVRIRYTKSNIDLQGYAPKDGIKYLSEFIKIPLINEPSTKALFLKDSLKIYFENKKFNPRTSKITYSKADPSIIEKINGKKYWGTDGSMPILTYLSIRIFKGNKYIELPKNAFDDLFEPNFPYVQIYYDPKTDILYIASSNSHAATGYEVLWIIEKGKYKERKIINDF